MSSLTWKPFWILPEIRIKNTRRRCIIFKRMYIIEAESAVQKRRRRLEFDTDSNDRQLL
jgi:hypothetical protein